MSLGKNRPKISAALKGKVCSDRTKLKIGLANSNPSDETRIRKSIGIRAANQNSIFVISMDGILSTWLSLESLLDEYGIIQTTLRRTLNSNPISRGKFKGWRLISIIPRNSLPKLANFLLLSRTRIKSINRESILGNI